MSEVMETCPDYFRMEAAERLERLISGLMALERSPGDGGLISDLFREAHSLKGAAGVTGLTDISEICHKMEDLLSDLRDDRLQADTVMIDALLGATDAVRELVAAKAEQRDCDVVPADVLQRLSNLALSKTQALRPETDVKGTANAPQRRPSPESDRPIPQDGSPQPAPHGDSAGPEPPAPAEVSEPTAATGSGSVMDTVRLRVDALEALGNLTGELMVAGDRLQRHLTVVRKLHDLVGSERNRHTHERSNDEALHSIAALVHKLVDDFSTDVTVIEPLISEIHEQVLDTRMLPLSVLFDQLPRFLRDHCRQEGKQIELQMEGAETRVDRHVLEQLRDPVVHLMRNAFSHGIESPDQRESQGKPPLGTVHLRTARHGDQIRIVCEDDGRGIDRPKVLARAVAAGLVTEAEAAELSNQQIDGYILHPGFSTAEMITDVSGRGVGMDVVASRLESLRGTLEIQSEPGQYTRFVLEFPASVATLEGLLVEAAGYTYVVPTASVVRTARVKVSDLQAGAGGEALFDLDGRPVPLVMLAGLLGRQTKGRQTKESRILLAKPGTDRRLMAGRSGKRSGIRDLSALSADILPVVVARHRDGDVALGVDRFWGIQTIVAKGLGDHIHSVRGVAGATILGTGLPALILDPGQLVQKDDTGTLGRGWFQNAADVEQEAAALLIVDDSLTTRMMEKSILESAGHIVDTAVSAEDALAKIENSRYQLFVVDVEMPGLNGFELTQKLRQDERFAETPIVIVTSLATEEHRRRGLEAGANAYITKSQFDQNSLLDTVERLVGR